MTKKKHTESDLAFLGHVVTELWKRKLDSIVSRIEEGMDADIAIDHKVLQAAAKWVLDNNVYAAPDSEDERSAIHDKIERIRNKSGKRVLDFKKEQAERGLG